MSLPLPYDILETIFAFAAGFNVCLVASWARNIALREMLHTVVLDSYDKHMKLLENNRLGDPPASYGSSPPATIPLGHHVRRALAASGGADMHALYRLCPRLESLAIPASRLIAFTTSAPAVFLHLRRLDILSAGPSSITSAVWSNPLRVVPYKTLTHLRFHALPINHLPFEQMPHLSHLALPASSNSIPGDYDALIQRCPALVMLVLTLSAEYSESLLTMPASEFRAHDKKMYICPRTRADRHSEWLHDVQGPGLSVWEDAAQFCAPH